MENVRKHRDIELVTTDNRRNQLVSEPIYHTTKYFSENLMAIGMKKNKSKLPIGWNVKIIGLFKDELGGRIMNEFVGLTAKIYVYLMDDDKGTKKLL